jgi:hypothetical protein
MESFLRELRSRIDEQLKTLPPETEMARNAVRIGAELDQYITPLAETIQQIAGLSSRIEALQFGTEAKSAPEASREPETDQGISSVDFP